MSVLAISVLVFLHTCSASILNIEERGAIANNNSLSTCKSNTKIFNETLWALNDGDSLLVPKDKVFWFIGGIYASNLTNVTIIVDGSIYYTDDRDAWPTNSDGHVKECMYLEHSNGITFTSNNDKEMKGLINGNGKKWWGAVDYLRFDENRPRLLHIHDTRNIFIDNIYFKDSPYWTVYLADVANVEIAWSNVSARRDSRDYHDFDDLTAFNTDGFDVAGENIHIHDCEIWNDDDCIAVKQQTGSSLQSNCSRNMLFERINASGVGLTIGSIGASAAHTCVDNITFRNVHMHHTFKGIYMKSRPDSGTGSISNVLYENIWMDRPTQVPIWIGPQQAGYKESCSLLWPTDPFAKCPVPSNMDFVNITLRNITINSPKQSPGVILGNTTNPMRHIVFDGVVVNNPGTKPWG
eukprot:115620_1